MSHSTLHLGRYSGGLACFISPSYAPSFSDPRGLCIWAHLKVHFEPKCTVHIDSVSISYSALRLVGYSRGVARFVP